MKKMENKRFKKGGIVPLQVKEIDKVLVTYTVARIAILSMSLN